MKKFGKALLLIAGIGLIGTIALLVIFSLLPLFTAILGGAMGDGTLTILSFVSLLIMFLMILLYVLCAGSALKAALKNDEHSVNRAFVWAIVILLLNVAGIFTGIGLGVPTIVAFALDACYILGAFLVKLAK